MQHNFRLLVSHMAQYLETTDSYVFHNETYLSFDLEW